MHSQGGCWACREDGRTGRGTVRPRAGKQGPGQGPRHPYPIEEWEIVKQEGVGEGTCTEDLTKPRAFQLREPGRQEGRAGHHRGARVGVRGRLGATDQDGMSL